MDTFGFLFFFLWLLADYVVFLTFMAYLGTLHLALQECSPQNQALSPALVWLQVVPLVGFIWQFFVVRALSTSLANEWRSRGMPPRMVPEARMGLIKAIVDALALVFTVAFFVFPAWMQYPEVTDPLFDAILLLLGCASFFTILGSLTLFITYWVAVRKCARELRLHTPWHLAQTPAHPS